jgi:hypothetical protein
MLYLMSAHIDFNYVTLNWFEIHFRLKDDLQRLRPFQKTNSRYTQT